MRDYFRRRYSPNNMAIVAAGKVDFEQLVADAERFCGNWPAQDHCTPRCSGDAAHRLSPDDQTPIRPTIYFANSTRPAAEDLQRFAARIVATILGDESGSRLYWSLIDSGRANRP